MLLRHRRSIAPVVLALACLLTSCATQPPGQPADGVRVQDAVPVPVLNAVADDAPAPTPTDAPAQAAELTPANFVDTVSTALAAAPSYDFSVTVLQDGDSWEEYSGSVHRTDTGLDYVLNQQGFVFMIGSGGDVYGNKGHDLDPQTRSFVRFRAQDGLADYAIGAPVIASLSPVDASQGASQDAAPSAVTPVGAQEQLDGDLVQRYDVTVGDGEDAQTFSVWLGEDLVVRKWVVGDDSSSVETRLSHVGSAGPVAAPTAAEITGDAGLDDCEFLAATDCGR